MPYSEDFCDAFWAATIGRAARDMTAAEARDVAALRAIIAEMRGLRDRLALIDNEDVADTREDLGGIVAELDGAASRMEMGS